MDGLKRGSQRGQSIIEYMVVAAAVIVALVAFSANMTGGIEQVGTDAATAMENVGGDLAAIDPQVQ